MNLLKKIDSRFLMANFNFLNEIKVKLLNEDLLCKLNRRLEVLKCIENVSKPLEVYFYGSNYKYVLDKLSLKEVEFLAKKILFYEKKEIDIKTFSGFDEMFSKISKKSYGKIKNYAGGESFLVSINSNEIFLKDYDEIDELYYISKELGDVNLNFKVLDIFSKSECFEDRINDNKKENYISTNITLLSLEAHKSYKNLVENICLSENILNRLEQLDPNSIWKYYLLIMKINDKEDKEIIIDLCNYIYSNVQKFSYLDVELFEKIGAHSLVVLCDIYLGLKDYEKLNLYIDLLDKQYPNCLDSIYFKSKILKQKNNESIDDFLRYTQNKVNKNYTQYSLVDNTIKKIYDSLGEVLEQRGNYILAAQNFFKGKGFCDYLNKIGQVVVDSNNSIYKNNRYNSGIFFTSKPFCDIDFISDKSHLFNMFDIADTDYSRTFILELCAKEIRDYNICGEVAELGVFRGDFAKFLNEIFYDRKLYLFDTFEGFDEKDMEIELKNKFMREDNLQSTHHFLKNVGTSVDLVMGKMKYKENVIIKKGYFPDSANLVEEKFCFVSLDVDLFKPMFEGLKYFYERLTPGGYIFIHDYNHKAFGGIKEAVKKFENIIGKRINKVPICDHAGSLIITK